MLNGLRCTIHSHKKLGHIRKTPKLHQMTAWNHDPYNGLKILIPMMETLSVMVQLCRKVGRKPVRRKFAQILNFSILSPTLYN